MCIHIYIYIYIEREREGERERETERDRERGRRPQLPAQATERLAGRTPRAMIAHSEPGTAPIHSNTVVYY